MLRFGDFFHEEWECQVYFDPCNGPEDKDANKALHHACCVRYVANIHPYEYEQLKDARLVK